MGIHAAESKHYNNPDLEILQDDLEDVNRQVYENVCLKRTHYSNSDIRTANFSRMICLGSKGPSAS